jgi:N-acetylmuramoyl-L-alanine amidase
MARGRIFGDEEAIAAKSPHRDIEETLKMQHKVRRGECMASIAAKYGFSDYRDIYQDPANAALKAKRPNPSLLFPGDLIEIPERKPTIFECETGKTHAFELKLPKRMLSLRLEEMTGTAIGEMPVKLVTSDRQTFDIVTDKAGNLRQPLPLTTKWVTLYAGSMVRHIRIADLNPMRDAPDGGVSGIQARLKNLGFFAGTPDGRMGPETEDALADFRASLPQDPGENMNDLIAALEKAHGV